MKKYILIVLLLYSIATHAQTTSPRHIEEDFKAYTLIDLNQKVRRDIKQIKSSILFHVDDHNDGVFRIFCNGQERTFRVIDFKFNGYESGSMIECINSDGEKIHAGIKYIQTSVGDFVVSAVYFALDGSDDCAMYLKSSLSATSQIRTVTISQPNAPNPWSKTAEIIKFDLENMLTILNTSHSEFSQILKNLGYTHSTDPSLHLYFDAQMNANAVSKEEGEVTFIWDSNNSMDAFKDEISPYYTGKTLPSGKQLYVFSKDGVKYSISVDDGFARLKKVYN